MCLEICLQEKKVTQILTDHGCLMTSLVSPDADLSFVEVGNDVAIEQQTSIDTGVRIGDHSCIKRSASVGHETVLESFVSIGPGATVCGHVYIHAGNKPSERAAVSNNDLEIGPGSIVGAGAVVTKNVPAHVTVIGNPARILEKK